ncbi:hypothetical protein B9Z55_020215 [Caenorhabditis nigoni]|uniref:SPK domain-containing protein n=1 Tax=Caenorhabditis nigoni TaxID=1611254 RepID=A0A2G5TMH6_9PELO|nr:hypothetical protein B9Z55_020215 [Caenorhabditis nigoni]
MAANVSDVIRYISDRIGNYNKPESLSKWCKKSVPYCNLKTMRANVSYNLDKIDQLEGYSLMEKLQLVFIFSRPVSDGFVQKLKYAKFEIEQDSNERICRFSTEDGSIVRFSDHHKDVKYFEGVLCLNSPIQRKANNARMSREEKRGQENMKNDNTGAEMKEGPEQFEPMQEELDWEVKKEIVEDISLEKEPTQEVDEDMTIRGSLFQETFNGRINYEELDAQEFVYPGFPPTAESKTSIRVQKRHQSSTKNCGKRAKTSDSISTSDNQKNVRIRNPEKTSSTSSNTFAQLYNPVTTVETSTNASGQSPPLEATPAIPTPDEPKISILVLVAHIENIALFYNLESLQKKAFLAIKKIKQMKESGRDKTLTVKKFNLLSGAMMVCLEENRISKTDDSISLKSLFKHLHLFLIRPLGPEVVHEALESIDQKIEEFKNKNDAVAPTIISESLTHLLMATGF